MRGCSGAGTGGGGGGGRRGGFGGTAGIERPYFYNELIGKQGGHTALILAARGGYTDAVKTLVAAGADVNHISAGDKTSPLLIAAINGHFDLAKWLLDQGADPNAAASNGVTPLYAALNVTWAPRALYPQPRAFNQQQITYLDFMKALLEKGADPNLRLTKKVWYSEYNFDLAGVDEIGATPFWRAAFAGDVPAMALLFEHGADPNISDDASGRPPAARRCRRGARSDRTCRACRRFRSAVPACRRCRRPPVWASVKASPPTRTFIRRRASCPASSSWSKWPAPT